MKTNAAIRMATSRNATVTAATIGPTFSMTRVEPGSELSPFAGASVGFGVSVVVVFVGVPVGVPVGVVVDRTSVTVTTTVFDGDFVGC